MDLTSDEMYASVELERLILVLESHFEQDGWNTLANGGY
jgi:hypothetical protein